jgi:hypothetical protein
MKFYHISEMTRMILSRGLKIFAVLLLINQAPLVSRLIEKQTLHNTKLPFTSLYIRDEILPLDLNGEQKTNRSGEFYGCQWEVLVPEFFRSVLSDVPWGHPELLPGPSPRHAPYKRPQNASKVLKMLSIQVKRISRRILNGCDYNKFTATQRLMS